MNLLKKILKELRLLIEINESSRTWHAPLLTAVCVGVPLLSGWYYNQLTYGLMACLGGLVILYLPFSGAVTNRISTILICSFGFLISFTIGQFFSFSKTAAVISLGLFSIVVHWIILYYKANAPGSLFFILIAALSVCQPHNLTSVPFKVGLIALGTMFSAFIALTYTLMISARVLRNKENIVVPLLSKNQLADFWEAIILGGFMAITLAIGFIMEIQYPYWITISCAAVMQGASLYNIWQRTFQRIFGTFIGLGLCWLFLSFVETHLMICLFIIALIMIVEMLIVRNYALAVIFITPLAILLSEASTPEMGNPTELISLRFYEIVIGSFLGAIGGWVLHKEKIRYATIKGLRKINVGLKKQVTP